MKFLTQDYYEILDVAPGADNEAVKRAYRLVRRSFRPDSMAIHSLYSTDETEAIGSKIDEAFRILSRPESSGRYAKYHRTAQPGMAIPRRPEDFFDQVHQLDAATPIEALARAVGSEDEVIDSPVPAVAQLRPRIPAHATPVKMEALPANTRMEDVDTDPALSVASASAAGAVPESHIDLFLDALEEVEEVEEVEDMVDVLEAPTLIAAALVDDSIYDLPDASYGAPLEPQAPSFEYEPPSPRELDYADVDALLSSVAARPISTYAAQPPPAPPAPSRQAVTRPSTAPVRHAPHPAARPVDRAAVRTRVPTPYASTPVQNEPMAQSPVEFAASTAATVAVAPVGGPPQSNAATMASVAAVNHDLGPRPRRWSRETIRTRAVGQLTVQGLSPDDIEAFEMDCGGMGGEFIKQVRRALDVNIEDIASRTKISTGMLRYIEADELEFLPARVYLRGYLTQIGRLLKLPLPRIVDGYMRANGLGK
jgi:hypothetical protein